MEGGEVETISKTIDDNYYGEKEIGEGAETGMFTILRLSAVDLEQHGFELCGSNYMQIFFNQSIGDFFEIFNNSRKTFFSSIAYFITRI